jgi:hypothetical protein
MTLDVETLMSELYSEHFSNIFALCRDVRQGGGKGGLPL